MAVTLKDVLRNHVKEKLARDEVVASMIVRAVRGIEIARIAKTCGFDTLYVDLEHNTFSIDTCSQICIAALDAGITPFVRVPTLGPEFVARVLDGGALGVIGPHIRSAAEANELVRVAKYPPLGERSAGGQLAQFQYRDFPAGEANAAANAANTVIAMLETKDGLERVDEIAAVEGIDILLIGTNDLCAELGIPGQYDHKLIRDAYKRAIAACRKRGKHVGIGGVGSRPDLVAEFVAEGARYVSIGSDLSFLIGAATEKAKFVHGLKTGGKTPKRGGR
jgi:2-keto-3-deoxy-L-rhamnonate aldolase RhmA